jgi:nucleotidyltransferase substrate binding protein (TIGR01987 family)
LRLKEALDEDISNPLLYDGVIQRFEFTYELAWKLMKAYLEYEGIAEVNSPRGAFKEAYKAGLIFEGDIWIDMIGDRNLAAHTYNEEMAKAIYNRIKDQYFERFVTFGARMAEVMK